MMNKKAQGSETLLWIYRFILIGLISLAHVIIVANHYSVEYDVRPAEAVLLSKRVINCVSDKGSIDLENYNKENIVKCINASGERENIEISLNYINQTKISKISIGNDLTPLCGLKKNAPYCLKQGYYVLFENEKARLDLNIALLKLD